MRRLLRRAFNLAAVVSALLFVGVCVLWVRGYYRHDELVFRNTILFSDHGNLCMLRWPDGRGFRVRTVPTPRGTEHVLEWPSKVSAPPFFFRLSDALACAVLSLPSLGLVLWEWRQRRQRQRWRRMGCCHACGYDLRAPPPAALSAGRCRPAHRADHQAADGAGDPRRGARAEDVRKEHGRGTQRDALLS